MPTPTEQLLKVEDQLLDSLASIQKPVIDAVKKLAQRAESLVPQAPSLPGSERLPAVDELLLSQFVIAEKLLQQQKDFTSALLDAVKPVSNKVAGTESKPKAARSTKAA